MSKAIIPLIAVAIVALTACERERPLDAPPEAGDVAVAYVFEEPVWMSDLKREAVAQGIIGDGEPLDVSTADFEQVLNSVIDQRLLAAEARRLGLDEDPETLRRLKVAEDRILGDVLVERRVQQVVTDEVIEGVYRAELRSSQLGEEYHARRIVTDSEADARAVREQIDSGADFESLVFSLSVDPDTRFDQGDLGWFTVDLLPEEYGQALREANAEEGDIVGPFQVEDQWVLLKVEGRREEQPISLEAARPQIVRYLTFDEVREIIETLRADAERKDAIVQVVEGPPGADAVEPASAPPRPPGALEEPEDAADAPAEAGAAEESESDGGAE